MNPPNHTSSQAQQESEIQQIASQFVSARQKAASLADFPGVIPETLEQAYKIQERAIEIWPSAICGWKVGRIPVHLEAAMGIDRLAGPIFKDTVVMADSDDTIDMPIFVGGFAAIEAEFVAVIGEDAAADKLEWSLDEAAAMIADLRIGLEIASSPLATINELGPPVVVSDFGNNLGLVIGPSISDWRTRDIQTMHCVSTIDGQVVGDGGAFKLTGGFIRSVQFLLELCARRGRPLRAGDTIATGQTTGIHDVEVGQTSSVDFADDGKINIKLVAAQPTA